MVAVEAEEAPSNELLKVLECECDLPGGHYMLAKHTHKLELNLHKLAKHTLPNTRTNLHRTHSI